MHRARRILNFLRRDNTRSLVNAPAKKSGGYQSGPGKWIMLTIPAATFCLGTWQVRRREWKNNLIEKINARTTMQPLPLPEIRSEQELKELEYCKFTVEGEFDHSREIYIRPRMAVTPKDSAGGGSLISTSPRVGAQVVTPFYMPDKGYSILINRGFVEENQINPATRHNGQVTGIVPVTGIFRRTETGTMIPANVPGEGIWRSTNVEEMARLTGTRPILLEATAEATFEGGPIGGQTRIRLWNQHASYIITWYSIAALTSFIWYSRYMR